MQRALLTKLIGPGKPFVRTCPPQLWKLSAMKQDGFFPSDASRVQMEVTSAAYRAPSSSGEWSLSLQKAHLNS